MESEIVAISDVKLTRSIYLQYEPYRCTCAYCRNVQSLWAALLTTELRSILSSLGIDPDKPDEIVDFGHVGNGRVCQILWPFVAVSKDISNFPGPPQINADAEVFIFRHEGKPETSFDATGRRCFVRIAWKNVPWVLAEPEPAMV